LSMIAVAFGDRAALHPPARRSVALGKDKTFYLMVDTVKELG
jgi:hypothetical protein